MDYQEELRRIEQQLPHGLLFGLTPTEQEAQGFMAHLTRNGTAESACDQANTADNRLAKEFWLYQQLCK